MIEHTATVEGVVIPGTDFKTVYRVEVTGIVSLGSSGGGDRYHGFYPGEGASAEITGLVVLEAMDFRFGDNGVPLDFVDSQVTGEQAGDWLLGELKTDHATESLEEKLIESLFRHMDDMASLRAG